MKQLTEKGYLKRIRSACQTIGTYRIEFEEVIGRLAELYVRRNLTKKQFEDSGSKIIVTQINKSGNEYKAKNPLLQEVDHINKMILDIEKELGLTPSAIKKINVELMKASQTEHDPLTEAIKSLNDL